MFKKPRQRLTETEEYKNRIKSLDERISDENEVRTFITIVNDYSMLYYFKELEPDAYERFIKWSEEKKEKMTNEISIAEILSKKLPDGSN